METENPSGHNAELFDDNRDHHCKSHCLLHHQKILSREADIPIELTGLWKL
jgi:hypothetical protein